MNVSVGRFLLRMELQVYEGLIGVSSLVSEKDNFHVGFFDLDGKSEEESEAFLRDLISKEKLSDCVLLKSSSGNYHGVCFSVKPFWYWVKLNLFNPKHAGYSVIRKEFVLRVSSKKGFEVEFVKVIPSEFKNTVSESHITFFNNRFKDCVVEGGGGVVMKDGIRLHFYNGVVRKW